MSKVIRIEGVSKRYKLGLINRKMLYQEIQSRWARWRGKEDPNARISERGTTRSGELWALKDVSFDVDAGDVVGIIGHNGSGKSTLLKILSQVTLPTEGRVLVKGRVASLLEVGTGFHPELTGRDNVFLNGVILGMTHKQVEAKFDSIVDFSGVEEFIDTPVKRYSSGMRVRLAFAVAAHLDPEILIIDEVLAVGDQAFQQKCLGKMGEVARDGRTVLFVSHQAAAVENLCRRGIVLEHGRVKFMGSQTDAIGFYVSSYDTHSGALAERTDRSGNGDIRIVNIEFRDTQGRAVQSARAGQDLDVVLTYENRVPRSRPALVVGLNVRTQFDAPVFQQTNTLTGQNFDGDLPARGTFVCRLRRLPMPSATYRVGFFVTSQPRGGQSLDAMASAVDLHVEGGDFFGSGRIPPIHAGVALVDAEWRLDSPAPTVSATVPANA